MCGLHYFFGKKRAPPSLSQGISHPRGVSFKDTCALFSKNNVYFLLGKPLYLNYTSICNRKIEYWICQRIKSVNLQKITTILSCLQYVFWKKCKSKPWSVGGFCNFLPRRAMQEWLFENCHPETWHHNWHHFYARLGQVIRGSMESRLCVRCGVSLLRSQQYPPTLSIQTWNYTKL